MGEKRKEEEEISGLKRKSIERLIQARGTINIAGKRGQAYVYMGMCVEESERTSLCVYGDVGTKEIGRKKGLEDGELCRPNWGERAKVLGEKQREFWGAMLVVVVVFHKRARAHMDVCCCCFFLSIRG